MDGRILWFAVSKMAIKRRPRKNKVNYIMFIRICYYNPCYMNRLINDVYFSNILIAENGTLFIRWGRRFYKLLNDHNIKK